MLIKPTKFGSATETAKAGNSYKNEVRRRKLPINEKTFRLYPVESLSDHPIAFLNWVKRTNYDLSNEKVKAAIKDYFNNLEAKLDNPQ